ncbi:MAG: hypothetical protein U0T83_04220 [Bacteriovoracaceae bacterium]
MGAINFTINMELVLELKRLSNLNIFVETGTFKGDSLELVEPYFNTLYSCELNETHFQYAKDRFKKSNKVKISKTNSPQFLTDINYVYDGKPTFFWLDAHFMSQSKKDTDLDKCPLLDELNSINQIDSESVILIDDARYFLSPPPFPNNFRNWPDFTTLIKKLFSLSSNHNLVVFNDVLVFYPSKIKNELFEFISKRVFDHLKFVDKAKEYDTLIEQINRKEHEINEKESEIDEKEAEIHKKEIEIHSKDNEIKTLLVACEERRLKIDSINLKLKKLEDELMEKDKEIKKLKSNKKGIFF